MLGKRLTPHCTGHHGAADADHPATRVDAVHVALQKDSQALARAQVCWHIALAVHGQSVGRDHQTPSGVIDGVDFCAVHFHR